MILDCKRLTGKKRVIDKTWCLTGSPVGPEESVCGDAGGINAGTLLDFFNQLSKAPPPGQIIDGTIDRVRHFDFCTTFRPLGALHLRHKAIILNIRFFLSAVLESPTYFVRHVTSSTEMKVRLIES